MNYFVIVCTEYTECGANVGLSIEKINGVFLSHLRTSEHFKCSFIIYF